jgi:hypothetical protein
MAVSRALLLPAAVGVVTWSSSALACPSCVDPRDATTNALLGSTIFLSLVPLIFLFSVAAWVLRAERAAMKADADAARDVSAPESLPIVR